MRISLFVDKYMLKPRFCTSNNHCERNPYEVCFAFEQVARTA